MNIKEEQGDDRISPTVICISNFVMQGKILRRTHDTDAGDNGGNADFNDSFFIKISFFSVQGRHYKRGPCFS